MSLVFTEQPVMAFVSGAVNLAFLIFVVSLIYNSAKDKNLILFLFMPGVPFAALAIGSFVIAFGSTPA